MAAVNCACITYPRGSMMVILPGIILLLCGGLTLLVTRTSESSSSWTSVTSLSILIVGAIVTVGGFLFCTKMWCKYKPKKKKPPADGVSKNEPVSLVAVYRIRQEGNVNPGFVPDSQGQQHKSRTSGLGRQQPKKSREVEHSQSAKYAYSSPVDDADGSSKDTIDLEKGEMEYSGHVAATAQSSLPLDQQTTDTATPQSNSHDVADDKVTSKYRVDPSDNLQQSLTSGYDSADGKENTSDAPPKEVETSFTQDDEIVFIEESAHSREGTDASQVI